MSRPTQHVLFVEDEDDLRSIMQDALSDHGYEVTMARNGREALEQLGSSRFSHVVTDVSMPQGVSGLEVAEHALRQQPRPRVVVASGYQRSQLEQLPEGAHFLSKPYRIRQLLAALDG
ncbi:response regulator [Luteimonas sp. SDU82]|uniref:response regulator n=1 Tax=Luteimonas sp. SDU82 TaxID=3422592 RepID=UPI003EBA32B5